MDPLPLPPAVKVVIRDAKPSDRSHLIRCLDAMQDRMVELDPWDLLARTPDHGPVNLAKMRRAAQRSGGFILVAEADGHPAGAAFAYIRTFSRAERTAERPTRTGFLSDLSVLPGWRARGIGSRLLREVEGRFRRAGCDQIGLGVFVPNRAAQRLYRRVGYWPRGMWMVKRIGSPPKKWPRDAQPARRGRRKDP